MNYIIRLTYMDEKQINVVLPEEETTKFFEKLQKNEPYWAPNKETAFWTCNNQVRFISLVRESELKKAEEIAKAKEEEIKKKKKNNVAIN